MSASAHSPVVLVVAPVFDLSFPALGPSLLATELRRRGVPTRVLYASVQFALAVGYELSQRLASSLMRDMLGDALFHEAAMGDASRAWGPALDAVFAGKDAVPVFGARDGGVRREEAAHCAAAVPAFVESAARAVLAERPRVVGFSSVFQQNMASVAIARRVKQLDPSVVTVIGGANANEPMGGALLEVTDAFDYAFSGEADFAFPDFCQALLERGERPAARVIECAPLEDLDRAAVPAYDDYFAQVGPHADAGALPRLPRWLHYESSRGCWYGQKKHCTFCGLNALGLAYRSKSPARVLAEVEELSRAYATRRLRAVDNIMPVDFTRTVLPALARGGARYELSYEVKANLNESDLDALVLAGVREVQPGIESLATPVLKKMDKGVTALQNVRVLRECASRGVRVFWNLLTAVPGETRADYEAMLGLIPLLEHLQPPEEWGNVAVDRYSPYHFAHERYGIARLIPWEMYRTLYGPRADLARIAYHFDGEYETEFTRDGELRRRLWDALRSWSRAWESPDGPRLFLTEISDGRAVVYDSRACAAAPMHLLSAAALSALRAVRRPVDPAGLEVDVRAELERLLAARLAVSYEGRVVGLVTEPAVGAALRARGRGAAAESERGGDAPGEHARVALPVVR